MLDIQKLKQLIIKESGLIFDPEVGHIFTTNHIGLDIISNLISSKSNEEIKEFLTTQYEINGNNIDKDLFDFIYQLTSYGWIKNI